MSELETVAVVLACSVPLSIGLIGCFCTLAIKRITQHLQQTQTIGGEPRTVIEMRHEMALQHKVAQAQQQAERMRNITPEKLMGH